MERKLMLPRGALIAVKHLLFYSVVAIAFSGVAIGSASGQSLLDWASVFNVEGTVKSLGGGIDAIYLEDNISAGLATDMTALGVDSDGEAKVFNDTVSTVHDLGNGYVYATKDASQRLVIFAGVERLRSSEDTFVEFEFNQDNVCVRSGNPWLIHGARKLNDLLVHMEFTAGNLSLVEFKKWDGSGYTLIGSSVPPAPEGCFGNGMTDLYAYCSGSPVQGLPPTNADIWDLNFIPIQVPNPDSFIQMSVNVNRLLGGNVAFTSVVIWSPEDISFGYFRAMGHWAKKGE
jgi:hypothetical protein